MLGKIKTAFAALFHCLVAAIRQSRERPCWPLVPIGDANIVILSRYRNTAWRNKSNFMLTELKSLRFPRTHMGECAGFGAFASLSAGAIVLSKQSYAGGRFLMKGIVYFAENFKRGF